MNVLNESIESDIFASIGNYVEAYGTGDPSHKINASPKLLQDFKYLLDIKNNKSDSEFNDILDPFYHTNHKSIYRGLKVLIEKYINKTVIINFSELKTKKFDTGLLSPTDQIGFDITRYANKFAQYQPQSEIESWTTDTTVAYRYAHIGYQSTPGYAGIAIEFEKPKKIKKELLFEPTFLMNAIQQYLNLKSYYVRGHIIRISKKPIKCKVWYFPGAVGETSKLFDVVEKYRSQYDIKFSINDLGNRSTEDVLASMDRGDYTQ